ncbi:hypothetical protein FALCPG4_007084 [Fusarium falciforme]
MLTLSPTPAQAQNASRPQLGAHAVVYRGTHDTAFVESHDMHCMRAGRSKRRREATGGRHELPAGTHLPHHPPEPVWWLKQSLNQAQQLKLHSISGRGVP